MFDWTWKFGHLVFTIQWQSSNQFSFSFLQIIVVVITGTLFGVNLYGTLMLRQYFDQVWFLPPDTMGYKYSVTNSKVID